MNQGVEWIRELTAHLQSAKAIPLTPRELRHEIGTFAEPEATEAIAQQLFGIGLVCRRRKRSPAVVLDALTRGLQRADWDASELEKWESVKPALESLLALPALRVLVKAVDMSYDYSNLLDSARVMVDIRPVLDVNRERLEAAIVSHVLRIQYVNDEGSHSLSVLLDDSDVDSLREACEEASGKSHVIRTFMEAAGVRTIGPGGEYDERG